jgi:hypothetical protein
MECDAQGQGKDLQKMDILRGVGMKTIEYHHTPYIMPYRL